MTWEMKDSDIDAKWIEEMWGKFPCTKCVDKNGVENGNYRTGPVRGSFMHILTRSPIKQAANGQQIGGKFTGTALFPVAADISLLGTAARELALTEWPDYGKKDDAGNDIGQKLTSPLNQQAEKAKFGGYTPGGICINAVAYQRAPYAVNAQGAPIPEDAALYSGAWYFFVLQPFTYDVGVNKGVSFGLQGVMKIADDRSLGGGASDPAADFAGVSIDTSQQAAAINPVGLF